MGVSFAKSAAAVLGKPIVAVHHLAGHIESIFLDHGNIPLPAVVLVVSGGHTSLYLVPRLGEYRLIGRTRDDAAGEAYDKVARLLGLGYPGGPIIDRTAREGNEFAVDLPRPKFTHPDRNPPPPGFAGAALPPSMQHLAEFSFSGLKSAVVRELQRRGIDTATSRVAPTADQMLSPQEIADVCATFQRIVVGGPWSTVRFDGPVARRGECCDRWGRFRQQPLAPRCARPRPARGPSGVCPGALALYRQRRDDCGGRPPEARTRPGKSLGL